MASITIFTSQIPISNVDVAGMAFCGTLGMFQDGLPSFEQIWKNCKRVSLDDDKNPEEFTRSNGAFFYVIIYRLSPKSGPKEYAIYCGRSVQPQVRLDRHRRELEAANPLVVHHKVGRRLIQRGAEYAMFPLSFIPKTAKDNTIKWAWAETTFIAMFGSFNPYMLRIDPNYQSSEPVPAPPPELRGTPERETFHGTYSAPLANRIQTIAQGIKSSQSRSPQFQVRERFFGCNWSVPLLENFGSDCNLWVRTTLKRDNGIDWMWQFQTHPRRINAGRRLSIFCGGSGSIPTHFRPRLSAEEFPMLEPGSMVNVVVEIMCDPSQKHLSPYLDIPAVGPFDCWTQGSRVGIRLEFLDTDGQWKAKYLHNKGSFSLLTSTIKSANPQVLGEEIKHMDISWLHCMKTLATLLQWQWQPDSQIARQVWAPYNNKVRAINHDFFNQQIITSDPQIDRKPVPRLLSLNETANLIEARFGYDVHIGYFPGKELVTPSSGGTGTGRRVNCDLCQVSRTRALLSTLRIFLTLYAF